MTTPPISASPAFQLERHASGQLLLVAANGEQHDVGGDGLGGALLERFDGEGDAFAFDDFAHWVNGLARLAQHLFGQTGLVDTSSLGASQPLQLIVNGDANDSVQIADPAGEWTAAGSVQVDGASYDVYNDGEIQLLVASNVNTSFYS